MRVAFLFAGQFRPIDKHLIDKSLSILVKDIDYSIFSFCWEETAKSLNHSNIVRFTMNFFKKRILCLNSVIH